MLTAIQDIATLQAADGDASRSPRGWMRTGRRIANRCHRDRESIQRKRIFCQNSGACGSTYIVELLQINGIAQSFHEKTPDLLQIGLDHFESPLPERRLVRLLRYTRHDVYFEANNRLFSLTRQLSIAFPNASFIHLHRDGVQAVRSGMSKPGVSDYLRDNIRFRGTLAGTAESNPFARICHHWANMNHRIVEDLASISERKVVSIRFEDLVAGKVQSLECLLGQKLRTKSCPPINVRPTRSTGKFPDYPSWSIEQKKQFDEICGPVMSLIGR